MKKVSILTVNERIPIFFLYPVRKNKRRLRKRGCDVRTFINPEDKHLSSDILCLSSKYFTDWWHEPEKVFEFIENAKKHCNKIVWLDDSDSSGVTHFELLPHINLYLKKQLLKDKTLYTKALYGDRVFTDYYHKKFGVVDKTTYQSKPLDLSMAHKVQLSWHIGFGDMAGDILPKSLRLIRYLLTTYPRHLTPVDRTRTLDVMFRGSRIYVRNSVSFHRERIGEILDGMAHNEKALQGRVSILQYKKEMRDAKIVVSPFGWGEIGVRDFEAWIYGAALMKPDMSHMETWPEVFKPHETYYPINWDFSNLERGINELLADKQLRTTLAKNGQKIYESMISEQGMNAFCDWFVQQIEK